MSHDAKWLFAHYPGSFLCARLAAILLAIATLLSWWATVVQFKRAIFDLRARPFVAALSSNQIWALSGYLVFSLVTLIGIRIVYRLWMFRTVTWLAMLPICAILCWITRPDHRTSSHDMALFGFVSNLFGLTLLMLLFAFPIFRERAAES